MATLPTFPISTATFTSNTYTFDPLYASDTIAQSANIAGSLGVLKRGTVLFGPVSPAPITNATLLTTVATGASARVILAQDIDTTAGQVTGLVYTQGKFLDTAMTFSSNGAASDAASLWDYGVYVLTVEQRSGILVPMMKLPATGGPLPQSLSPKDALQASKEEVTAIKNAVAAFRPLDVPPLKGQAPAWAIAAFGETKPTPEEEANLKTAEEASELADKQKLAVTELEAKQAKELQDLLSAQSEERRKFVEHATKTTPPQQPAPHTPPAPPPHNKTK